MPTQNLKIPNTIILDPSPTTLWVVFSKISRFSRSNDTQDEYSRGTNGDQVCNDTADQFLTSSRPHCRLLRTALLRARNTRTQKRRSRRPGKVATRTRRCHLPAFRAREGERFLCPIWSWEIRGIGRPNAYLCFMHGCSGRVALETSNAGILRFDTTEISARL